MWIRSQNKRILTEINDVEIDGGFKLWGSCLLIGEYSTEEKALKVLDEIQNAVENTNYYNIDNLCLGTYALKRGSQVYEMPQDEEVEV